MSRTVAIVGGGYGGAAVAKALESTADVVLIDPREAFVNAAASLRSLTRPDWAGNMFFPFATLLTRGTVVRDRASRGQLDGSLRALRIVLDGATLPKLDELFPPPAPNGAKPAPEAYAW